VPRTRVEVMVVSWVVDPEIVATRDVVLVYGGRRVRNEADEAVEFQNDDVCLEVPSDMSASDAVSSPGVM